MIHRANSAIRTNDPDPIEADTLILWKHLHVHDRETNDDWKMLLNRA